MGIAEVAVRSKGELWNIVEAEIKKDGFELFDIEVPARAGGMLRVFISKAADGAAGRSSKETRVTVDDCAVVSGRLALLMENGDHGLGGMTLEVSSPGINRKLTRPQHYYGAIGERVRLRLTEGACGAVGKSVLLGRLESFDGETIGLEDERGKELVQVHLRDVREATTDFLF